jgi:hypothetical protein
MRELVGLPWLEICDNRRSVSIDASTQVDLKENCSNGKGGEVNHAYAEKK